jgi:hypothetical protein
MVDNMSYVNKVKVQGYNGTNFQDIRIDTSTRSIQTVDYAHHEIHSGSSFTCHYNNDVTNIGEMTVIAFNTKDATKWVHMFAIAESTGAAYFAIYENPTIDVDEGTDLAIYNRNRNSATAATVSTIETVPEEGKATSYNEVQAASANITTTTEITRFYIGGGSKQSSSGGNTRAEVEFVLDQNQQYAFMIYALTADDMTHNILLDWYEHTDQAA